MPIKLVYSSVPADDPFREQLSAHLYSLVQQGVLSEWHEQLIPAGADAAQERHRAWLAADILLLLISADYFVSDAYNSQEMQQALERHRSGQVLVIPILIRPCDWQATEVGHLQCLPREGIPVTNWENRDAALLSIAQELRQRITARHVPLLLFRLFSAPIGNGSSNGYAHSGLKACLNNRCCMQPGWTCICKSNRMAWKIPGV